MRRFTALFLAALLPALAIADERATTKEAELLVHRAVEFLKKEGKEKAFAVFNDPKGAFTYRDLYIVALDPKSVVLAHGTKKELIGKNHWDAKDADGKLFSRASVELAMAQGRGSNEYRVGEPLDPQGREQGRLRGAGRRRGSSSAEPTGLEPPAHPARRLASCRSKEPKMKNLTLGARVHLLVLTALAFVALVTLSGVVTSSWLSSLTKDYGQAKVPSLQALGRIATAVGRATGAASTVEDGALEENVHSQALSLSEAQVKEADEAGAILEASLKDEGTLKTWESAKPVKASWKQDLQISPRSPASALRWPPASPRRPPSSPR